MEYKTIKPWQKRLALSFGEESKVLNCAMLIGLITIIILFFSVMIFSEYFFKDRLSENLFIRTIIVASPAFSFFIIGLFSLHRLSLWAKPLFNYRVLLKVDIERARELALRYPEKYGSEILRRIKKVQETDDAIHLVPYLDCIEKERKN